MATASFLDYGPPEQRITRALNDLAIATQDLNDLTAPDLLATNTGRDHARTQLEAALDALNRLDIWDDTDIAAALQGATL